MPRIVRIFLPAPMEWLRMDDKKASGIRYLPEGGSTATIPTIGRR